MSCAAIGCSHVVVAQEVVVPARVVVHAVEYSGEETGAKIGKVRDNLKSRGYNGGMVITEKDEIAWLFNLRGEGNSSNEGLMKSPLFQSFALSE